MSSEKEFPPSIRRLQKARREGKVAKSQYVTLCLTWWLLIVALSPTLAWVRNGTLVQWSNYKVWSPHVAFSEALWDACKVCGLLIGVVAGSSLLVSIAQTRGLFLPSQLTKGLAQYKPDAFIRKVWQSAIDSWLGLIRCVVVVLVVGPAIGSLLTASPSWIESGPHQAFQLYWRLIQYVLMLGGVALTVIAAVAYGLVRWKFFRDLRMSLQEVRDEFKEDEGDPYLKATRKQEHRAMLFSEIEQRVKRSKVVIVRRAPTRAS